MKKNEYYTDVMLAKMRNISVHINNMDDQDAVAQLKKLTRLLNNFINEIEEMEEIA